MRIRDGDGNYASSVLPRISFQIRRNPSIQRRRSCHTFYLEEYRFNARDYCHFKRVYQLHTLTDRSSRSETETQRKRKRYKLYDPTIYNNVYKCNNT